MELKNTLKVIGISLLGVLGVGMSCYSHSVGMTLLAPSYEKVGAYSVQSYNDSVTFTKEELNECSYPYLTTKISELSNNPFIDSYVMYYDIYDNYSVQVYDFHSLSNNIVKYVYDVQEIYFSSGQWYFQDEETTLDFTRNLTIYSSWFVDNLAKQITLSASQLKDGHYEYFKNYVDNNYSPELSYAYIIYNGNVYNEYNYSEGQFISYTFDTTTIFFYLDDYGQFIYYDDDVEDNLPFTNSITIYSDYFADNLYAPNEPVNLLTAIVGLLTGGITGIASGVGSGVSTLTQQIFIVDNALSVFGGILVVFAGISLAIGLSRWIMQFLTSLGAKK